ncbi:MAG: single-stranded DNA-binding protein [Oscillospiraceae bacterium]|nr:single-stranded DNA-binding protein [Oscillospiraceae bacterium]
MDVDFLNQGLLRGLAVGEPRVSHVTHGVSYYVFPLEVERLSGATDTLNVVLSQDLLLSCPVESGLEYECTGEVRSFNNRSGVGGRLIITFYAKSIAPAKDVHTNRLELRGVLCKAPVVRRTPLGREICDLLLAVNRRYGRADYLPCIAWGGLARSCGEKAVGDSLCLTGRLQSRTYRKVTDDREEERVAYEVSILTLQD